MTPPPAISDAPSLVEHPVTWGAMDAFGHVNNTVYFRYFEIGRLDYFANTGIIAHMDAHQQGPILAHTECRFRIPLRWPDRVTIATRVSDLEHDRFTMTYRVFSHNAQAIAAEGTGRVVWFDYSGPGQKCPLPADIVAHMRRFDPGIPEAT